MNVEARVIYFDVETQRSAQEVVGGWKYPERFGLALAVAYDTHDHSYKSYTEATVADLIEILHTADLIVGFNHLRFDYRVLSAYTAADLQSLPNFDMHAQLWTDERLRVGLDKLGQSTLGRGKTGDGLASIRWWQQGHIDKIEAYCKQDVALTKDLFLHACNKGYLRYNHRGYGRQFDTSHWNEKIRVLTGAIPDTFLHQAFTEPVRFVTYSGIYDLSGVKTMNDQVSGHERKTGEETVLQKQHILFAFSAENMGAVKPQIKKRPAVRSLDLQPLTPDESGIHVNNAVLVEVCQKGLMVELLTRTGHVLRGYIQHFDHYALYMRIGREVVIVYWHGLLKFQKGVK